MKKIWLGVALGILALVGARSASAQSIGDDDRKCQKEILADADKYAAALHKQIIGSTDAGLAGKNADADGGQGRGRYNNKGVCVGGPNANKSCTGNGGKCKGGAFKNRQCDVDADCPGFCLDNATQLCTGNKVGGTSTCTSGLFKTCKGYNDPGNCDVTKGCAGGKCEINQRKGIAKAFGDAGTKLKAGIDAKCPNASNLTNLGFPNSVCKGECDTNFNPCTQDADCPATCNFDTTKLADCITQGQIGDLAHARSGDAHSAPLTRVMTSVQPNGLKTAKNPRARSTVTLPGLIQIGALSTSSGTGSAGGSSPISLARCQGSGAMNGFSCIEDAECKSDQVTASPPAVCVADCCDCSGAGACTTPGTVSAQAIALCTGSGQTVCDARGNLVPPGNYLTTPTETKSGGFATCIATHLARIPNLTAGLEAGTTTLDKGHCLGPNIDQTLNTVCDTDTICGGNGPCKGGLSTFGHVNITTAQGSTIAPIVSDVWLNAGAADICPKCSGGCCTSGVNGPGTGTCGGGGAGFCGETDGSTSNACLPKVPGAGWSLISGSGIANPFNLTSEVASLSEDVSNHVFCGMCNIDNTIGCSSDGTQLCPSGAGSCDHIGADTYAGFQGDPAYDDLPAAGQQVSASGTRNNYGGTAAGMFCTGKTNSIIDGSIGLPGPVRVKQAYVVNWTFSTK